MNRIYNQFNNTRPHIKISELPIIQILALVNSTPYKMPISTKYWCQI